MSSEWLKTSNPQWQGSGESNEIFTGNKVLKEYLALERIVNIPVNAGALQTENCIFSYRTILENMHSTRAIFEESHPKKILTLGGDCGVEPIPVSYLNQQYQNFGVVWIDAHADLNTPESSPSSHFHGMPLRLILGEGEKKMKQSMFSFLNPEQIFLVGVRDLDEAESQYINKTNLFIDNKFDFSLLKHEIVKRNLNTLYLHVDLDVIDPREYAHVKCPTEGGVNIESLINYLEKIEENFKVVGKSITEITALNEESLKPLDKLLSYFIKVN